MPKSKAPADTFAEPAYLRRLVERRTLLRVRLIDGREIEGTLEYWDTAFLRITRHGDPNLFIYKHEIKYLYEVED